MPYGNVWRFHRKLAHKVLNPEAVKQYHIVQENLVVLMCHAFLKYPEDFMAQVRLYVFILHIVSLSVTLITILGICRAAGRIVMAVTYGLPVQGADDRVSNMITLFSRYLSVYSISGKPKKLWR